MTTRLEIGLLGGLRLATPDADLPLPHSRRARLFVAWLALNPGIHGRSRIAGAIRPDATEADARRAVRQATWHAMRSLGPAGGALVATRLELGFDARACTVDVIELKRAARDGDLAAARALRERPLLPEHDDDWVCDARDELRAELAEIAARQTTLGEQRGDLEPAVAWARERAACDPLSESAQIRLMRLLAMIGDRAAAVQVAAELRQRLVDELGIVPSPATRATIDDLLLDDEPAPAHSPHTCWRCSAVLPAVQRAAFAGTSLAAAS